MKGWKEERERSKAIYVGKKTTVHGDGGEGGGDSKRKKVVSDDQFGLRNKGAQGR